MFTIELGTGDVHKLNVVTRRQELLLLLLLQLLPLRGQVQARLLLETFSFHVQLLEICSFRLNVALLLQLLPLRGQVQA